MQLPKWMLKIPGDLYFCRKPLWFHYKPAFHKIKGTQIRLILNSIKEGDILLRRYEGYLDTLLMPGFWCHAALYVGDNFVIQSIGSGVNQEDILDFCRCDSIALLRPLVDKTEILYAIEYAHKVLGAKTCYDWKFKKGNDAVYCTELINEAYKDLFVNDYEIIIGNPILTPDGLAESTKVDLIMEFTK